MASRPRSPYSLYILVGALLVLGLGLSWYRHVTFGVPWLPQVDRQIWSIEARVEFQASGEPVRVSLVVPSAQPGFEPLSEFTASPGYGLTFVEEGGARRAEWSVRSARGSQTLYYQVDVAVRPDDFRNNRGVPPPINSFNYAGPEATAVDQLIARATERSADPFTFARELIKEFNREAELAKLLEQSRPRQDWLVEMLQKAGVSARLVHVLNLEDGRRRQLAVNYLQVFDGDRYTLFDPASGAQGQAPNQLLWEQHAGSLVDVIGGHNSQVTFSILEQEVPASQVAAIRDLNATNPLDISIHSLPVAEQTLFKGILLIPVGILIVVIFRILVGLKTSGTFMPVLIAIAFIQTSLVTGLVGFFLIVGVGLMIRSYLSQHNLLLVARISAVIISVIIIIALLAIGAYSLGLSEGLKITFFPMIILAWTIERMSILWEEEGSKEVMKQGGGSLLVAILAYLAMQSAVLRHLMFNFIGLQFVCMALVLLLGRYTGYRLFELKRFRALAR